LWVVWLIRSEGVKLENVLELQWNYYTASSELYKDDVISCTDFRRSCTVNLTCIRCCVDGQGLQLYLAIDANISNSRCGLVGCSFQIRSTELSIELLEIIASRSLSTLIDIFTAPEFECINSNNHKASIDKANFHNG
jgi:hypothetical protein